MKRVIVSDKQFDELSDVFAMSKLLDELADIERTGPIPTFIYFSESNSSHGPRIKFYGGTKETSKTRTAPSMAFEVDGDPWPEIPDWLNKKNCPSAFNDEILQTVSDFIVKTRPLLLLVWFGKLDEAILLSYFEGHYDWEQLMSRIDCPDPSIDRCNSMEELDKICRKNKLYKF